VIVTTTQRPDRPTIERAVRLAAELGFEYKIRQNFTVRGMHQMWATENLLVAGPRDVRLLSGDQPPFFFHPSMALVRLKRLIGGGTDALVDVCGIGPGDRVLDCTAGLCADALVLSYAVGVKGEVVALEASPVLHAVIREGLQLYETGLPDVDAALRAITAVCAHHEEALKTMADNSFDVVYFDPMFEQPVTSSSSLAPLRSHAHMEPLSEEAVSEAVRVARRKVVLKDRRGSGQFSRLGFSPARVSASAVAYGVINVDS